MKYSKILIFVIIISICLFTFYTEFKKMFPQKHVVISLDKYSKNILLQTSNGKNILISSGDIKDLESKISSKTSFFIKNLDTIIYTWNDFLVLKKIINSFKYFDINQVIVFFNTDEETVFPLQQLISWKNYKIDDIKFSSFNIEHHIFTLNINNKNILFIPKINKKTEKYLIWKYDSIRTSYKYIEKLSSFFDNNNVKYKKN